MPKTKSNVSPPAGEGCTVDVRPIDNGFIVRKSSYGPKGYQSSECYSPTKPKIEVETAKPKPKGKAQVSSLGKAIKATE